MDQHRAMRQTPRQTMTLHTQKETKVYPRLNVHTHDTQDLRVLMSVTRSHLSQPLWIAARYIVTVKGKKELYVGSVWRFPHCNYTVGPYRSGPTTMCM